MTSDSPHVSFPSSMCQSSLFRETTHGSGDEHLGPQDISLTLVPGSARDPLPRAVAFGEDGAPTGWRLKEENGADGPGDALFWGDLQNGKKHGKGRYVLADGTLYVGEFHNGLAHGEGTIQWPNKNVYTGQWKDGQASGHGLLRRPGEWQYVGQFLEDMRHGHGRCEWASRAWYDGGWSWDQKQGVGEDGEDALGATLGRVFSFQNGERQELLVEAPMAPLSSKFKADARWQGTLRVKLGKVVSKKNQGQQTETCQPEVPADTSETQPLSKVLPPRLPQAPAAVEADSGTSSLSPAHI